MHYRYTLSAALLAATCLATPALAQNYNLNPAYGTYNLQSGFLPDPQTIQVVAGGPIDAGRATGGQCAGFIADAPDVRINFTGGSFSEINFSAQSNADTTLVINDPNGVWHCDDDSGGDFNPLVRLTPLSGQYDVWVGTFGSTTAQATLAVSELPYGGAPGASPTPPPASGPDYSLQPGFGTYALTSGFTPDPFEVQLIAGGGNSASQWSNGQCAGFVADAPDVRINFTGGSFSEINFSARSNSDTTLIVNDPNGQWFCDDDSGDGLNPLVELTPISGQYDIWVGTFGSSTAQATLAVSELPYGGGSTGSAPRPPTPPRGPSGPDYSLTPGYGTYSLASGFTPDPFEVQVVAGGGNSASDWSGGQCAGFVADAPDVRVNFTGGAFSEINFSARSNADTTLIVNDPNGQWFCDDDSGGNLNPLVELTPISGQYDIWVGTFGSSTAQATLAVSELPYGGGSAGTAPRPPTPPRGPSGPDYSLAPGYGTYSLASGFTPDPFEVQLVAGGNNSASDWSGGQCAGFIADAPDVRLMFQGGSFPELYFSADSGADTTLVINGPNGEWFCDDDGGNGALNPLVRMAPVSGQYDIWVGTYGSSTASAVLSISELYSR